MPRKTVKTYLITYDVENAVAVSHRQNIQTLIILCWSEGAIAQCLQLRKVENRRVGQMRRGDIFQRAEDRIHASRKAFFPFG